MGKTNYTIFKLGSMISFGASILLNILAALLWSRGISIFYILEIIGIIIGIFGFIMIFYETGNKILIISKLLVGVYCLYLIFGIWDSGQQIGGDYIIKEINPEQKEVIFEGQDSCDVRCRMDIPEYLEEGNEYSIEYRTINIIKPYTHLIAIEDL